MDYAPFVQKHRETGADITVAALPMDAARAEAFGVMKVRLLSRVCVGFMVGSHWLYSWMSAEAQHTARALIHGQHATPSASCTLAHAAWTALQVLTFGVVAAADRRQRPHRGLCGEAEGRRAAGHGGGHHRAGPRRRQVPPTHATRTVTASFSKKYNFFSNIILCGRVNGLPSTCRISIIPLCRLHQP